MSINLTDSAAAHVKSYLTKEPDAKGLRIGVKTTGCSGYMYVVETARDIRDTDNVFESHGIQVVIDDDAMVFLDKARNIVLSDCAVAIQCAWRGIHTYKADGRDPVFDSKFVMSPAFHVLKSVLWCRFIVFL